MNRRILFFAILFFPLTIFAQKTIGTWNGSISLPSGKLSLIIHIKKEQDSLVATWDSPKQNVFGMKASRLYERNDSLIFMVDNIHFVYNGKIISDDSIHGQFMQNGAIFPLDLIRGELKQENKLNQDSLTLADSYKYYKSDSVKFRNINANITLAGTLTIPLNYQNDKSAIVLISGSGPSDRDENGYGHTIFAILADHLTKNGYPVLRYDDRGVGQSKGDYKNATIKDFSSDALAAINFLRDEKHFKQVGLIGHSEGGFIAPMIAADFPNKVNFIVLMAGPGVSGDSLLLLQNRKYLQLSGASDINILMSTAVNRDIYQIIKSNKDTSITLPKLRAYFWKNMKSPNADSLSPNVQNVYNQAVNMEVISIIQTDPSQYLNRVKCPVLALNGSKDVQVLPDENLAALKSGLTNSTSVTIEKLEGLNHLFQKANTGLPNEYEDISETLDPIFFEALDKWLLQLK